MTFEDRINTYYHSLNGTDKHIIKQIIINKPQWEEMTQQRLADLCNASTASIHRMLKRLNFSGFSEFKFYMIKRPTVDNWSENTESYRDFIVKTIDTTLEMNAEDVFLRVYDMIENAPELYGFGTGTEQRESLQSFSNHLMYYHTPLIMLDTVTDINLMSLRMKRGDVLFIASLSGNTPMFDEMMSILKLKGVSVISLTNNTKNAISAASDLNLYFQDDSFNGLKSLHWPAITLRILLDQLLHGYISYLDKGHRETTWQK